MESEKRQKSKIRTKIPRQKFLADAYRRPPDFGKFNLLYYITDKVRCQGAFKIF